MQRAAMCSITCRRSAIRRARSFGSIAAGTCSTSTRTPGAPSPQPPRRSIRSREGSAVEFQHVEPDPAIDDVEQAPFIERHVVALRCGAAAGRLRNEMADLARAERVGDIYDAQAAREPDRIHDRARDALAKLVCAEARRAGAAIG